MRKIVVLDVTILVGCLIGFVCMPDDTGYFVKCALLSFILGWGLRAFAFYCPPTTYTWYITDTCGNEYIPNRNYPTLDSAIEAAEDSRISLPSPNYLHVRTLD